MLAFPLFTAWHTNRHSWLPLPDLVWLFLYIIYLIVFAIFPVQEVCQHDLPPASSIIILSEQVWTYKCCNYSWSSMSGHSRKWTALLTAALTKPFLNSSSLILYLHIPISGQGCPVCWRLCVAPVADTFSASQHWCLLTGVSTVLGLTFILYVLKFSAGTVGFKHFLLEHLCELSKFLTM